MYPCDLDTSIPDWIIDHPETRSVFRQLGLDESCGGKSLGYLCRQRGLDEKMVLDRLLRCLSGKNDPPRATEEGGK